MAIKRLPDSVIAKIAAGEVIERPASVVKELIENAIDADATFILVEVEAGGQKLIRVSDNGMGILAEEAELAVQRHATSKLQHPDDLLALKTLGFRGEALATIAAVSRMTLATRHRSQPHGVELRFEGGNLRSRREVGQPAGTIVSVENLFFNTPARLKFLKSEATERRIIAQWIADYAMAYPHIRFVLTSDGRETFRSNGGQLADVALKVFGLETFRHMIPIHGQEMIDAQSAIHVTGFVSLPTIYRNDRSRMALFVNGRAVQDQNIAFAVTQAYHLLMERGRYPYAVILVSVPTDFVDVNVHPTKAEVRFQDLNLVFVAVQRTIREALMHHTHLTDKPTHPTTTTSNITTNLADAPIFADETSVASVSSNAPHDAFDAIPASEDAPLRPRTLPPLRVIGQLANAYIVAEGPAGLYLVDQFAASERVRYQQWCDQRALGAVVGQPIASLTVEIPTQHRPTLWQHAALLQSFGITLELFGTTTWRILTLPSELPQQLAPELLTKFLLALEAQRDPTEALTLLLAQATAYKTGQRLERDAMEALLRLLERCPSPLISPSGSATLVHISRDQLLREFSRRA